MTTAATAAAASGDHGRPQGRQLYALTGALMLSTFLAATETTFVTAAMPTIVGQLGGLAIYSWVFSGFMLSFTASIAVFGKLADVYGRRPIFLAAMSAFLLSSLLCGVARNMNELVAYRVLQGIGAGGLMPLVFTIIGDMYSLEQRARVQGLFASVWGIASVLGPVIGGFLVDRVSWRWVFLLNVPAGLVAMAVLMLAWKEVRRAPAKAFDVLGAALLCGSIVTLLLALLAAERPGSAGTVLPLLLFGVTVAACFALARVERRAADPIVPVDLFRNRLFLAACGHSFAVGFSVFGSMTFIPLFVQFGTGVGATEAGASLMPLLLTWVATANIGSRLLLRMPFRPLALGGTSMVVAGLASLATITAESSKTWFVVSMMVLGMGMGLSSPVFLIAIQTSLPKKMLGTATSTWQLCRSIGTAIGIAAMGAILSAYVGGALEAANATGSGSPPAASFPPELRPTLATAERRIFSIALGAAMIGLAFTALAPHARLRELVAREIDPASAAGP